MSFHLHLHLHLHLYIQSPLSPLSISKVIPSYVKAPLSGKFLELAPTYTVFG
jgi:hypothetical protein